MTGKLNKVWFIGVIVFLLFLIMPSTAFAHATVVRSSPSAGQSLAFTPKLVQIWFDEAVQPDFFDLVVTNSNGQRIDMHDAHLARENRALLECSVSQHVKTGYYLARWRAVSDDGHVVTGTIPFNIGTGKPAPVLLSANVGNEVPPMYLTISRFFEYGGILLFSGLIIFWSFIMDAKLRAKTAVISRFFRTTWLLWWISIISVCLSLAIQMNLVTGKSILYLWHWSTLEAIFRTAFSLVWLVQFFIVLFLAGALFILRYKDSHRLGTSLTLVFLLALIFTKSLTSHAITSPYPTYSVIADSLHMVCASIWLGSLLGLVLLLPVGSMSENMPLTVYFGTIRRFSIWGIITILILVATGVYATFLNIPDWYTFVHTLYGRTLGIKISLVVIMLLFALMHLVKGNKQGQTRPLTKTIRVELFIGICVLLATALFTNLPTPRATPGPYENTVILSDGSSIMLRVTPNRAGVNDITVEVKSENGTMASRIENASLALTSLDEYSGTNTVPLQNNHNGVYHLVGLYFPNAGRWYVTVHVMVNQMNDEYAHFQFLVGSPI